MHQFLAGKKADLEKAIGFLEGELTSMRTGRASTGLVETIMVTAYGSDQELKNLASIGTPDAQTIQIEPWDEGVVKDVEKALIEADLGMMPNVAGKTIRLAVPPLTEDTRKEMAKVVGKKVEEARIRVRTSRDDVKKAIEQMEKDKEISEDERYQLQEELDALVKSINETLDKMGKDKESQIMTV